MLPYREDRMIEFFSSLPATAEQAALLAQRCDERIKTRFGEEPVLTAERPEAPIRHVVEVRHDSFATGDFAAAVPGVRRRAWSSPTPRAGFTWVDEVTADIVYVRLHGDQELYVSGYTDQGIDWWAGRVADWAQTPGVRAGARVLRQRLPGPCALRRAPAGAPTGRRGPAGGAVAVRGGLTRSVRGDAREVDGFLVQQRG